MDSYALKKNNSKLFNLNLKQVGMPISLGYMYSMHILCLVFGREWGLGMIVEGKKEFKED